jgi:trigger factor
MPVVRQQFGDQVRSELLGDLFRQSYSEAITQQKLKPAGDPRIEQFSADPGADMRFVALVEVMPEISLQPLSGLTLDRYTAEVTEADVDAMLETMRRQRSEFVAVEREAAENDQVTVDFEGKIGGEVFEGGSGQDAKVVIGRGRVLADFEYALRGMKAGDTKNVMVQFPEDYGSPDVAGKLAFFDVTVKEVGEPRLPEINDEFCAGFGISEGGVTALREAVKSSMQHELDQAIRTRLRNQVLDKVYEANPIEVPKTMIEEAVQEIRQDTLRRIGMQNAAQLPSNDSLLEPGKKRAAMRLLVGELMQAANLTLDRSKVNERLDEMLGDYPNADDLRRQYVQNADLMRRIEASVMEDQLIDWIVGQAMVLEIPSTFSDITLFGKGPAA